MDRYVIKIQTYGLAIVKKSCELLLSRNGEEWEWGV